MKRYASYCYEPILAIPAALAVLSMAGTELGLETASFGAVLYTCLTCAVCAFFRYLHGRERLLLLGASAIFLLLPALYGLLESTEDYHYEHRYLWLIPLLGVGCDLCAVLCRRFRAARYVSAAAVIAVLVFFLISETTLSQACVMLFLAVLLLLFADETQTLWRSKSGHTEHALHLTFIAPFIAIWFALALLLPVRNSPYDWELFRNIWGRLQDFAISLTQRGNGGSADDLETYKVGFSDDPTSVTGNIEYEEKKLFRIERVSGSPPSRIYLAGQYCDTLEGLTWRATIEDDTDESNLDVLESRSTFSRAEHAYDYLQSIEVRITYREFASRFMIAPEKTLLTRNLLSQNDFTQQGHNFVFSRKMGINTEYVVAGYRMNRLHSAFLEFMREVEPITEDDWNLILVEYRGAMDHLTFDRLLEHQARMKTRYLHEFVLPDAAREFLLNAVGETDNAFERMMLLSQALSGFTYTTTPGKMPDTVTDGASFLEYFVGSRRGYCSHFATAMVLFAWSEGLPARYVYGFNSAIASEGTTVVTSEDAHAWCEIYFENVGWIPFDATPGYTEGEIWSITSENEPTPWVPTPKPTEPPVQPESEPEAENEESSSTSPALRIGLYILIGLVALVLFAIPLLLLDRLIHNRRFRQMTPAEQIRVLYRRNSRLLAYLELPAKEDETLAEYRERLQPRLPENAVTWLTPYEEHLYSASADAREVVASMLRGNTALAEAFREKSPRKYRLCSMTNRLL